MIRAINLALLVMLMAATAFAQNGGNSKLQQEAQEYYENGYYFKAITLFNKVLQADEQNRAVLLQVGNCYRNLFNYSEAEKYYRQVNEAADGDYPEALFYLALMEKYNGRYRDALNNFNTFLAKYSKKLTVAQRNQLLPKAKLEKKGCEFALTEQETVLPNFNFGPLKAPVNSSYNDYAPAIYQNDSALVTTSSRVVSGSALVDESSGEGFTDNFGWQLTDKGWKPNDFNNLDRTTNSRWHDGSGSFNAEGNKFYYTSCFTNGSTNCQIFVSEKKKGRWQRPEPLNKNVNRPNSDNRHPQVSATGDTLFFSSNRSGGQGGNDIWMCVKRGAENWGRAVNLGSNINTPFNEITPFYYGKDDVLLFGSDGHAGFGGIDLFLAEGHTLQQASVQNLGYPFNSSKDDCYLVLGNQKGYLASNRSDQSGQFAVYGFEIKSQQAVIAKINRSSTSSENPGPSYAKRQQELMARLSEDALYYQSLNGNQKNTFRNRIMERILAGESAMEYLPEEEKNRVNRVGKNIKASIITESNQLANLNEKEKEQLNKLIQTRLAQLAVGTESLTLATLDEETLNLLSRVSQSMVMARVSATGTIASMPELLPAREEMVLQAMASDNQYYTRLSPGKQQQVDKIIELALQTPEFQSEVLNQVPFYKSLPEDEKQAVQRLIVLRESENKATADASVPEERDLDYFTSLPAEDRKRVDRIIQAKVRAQLLNQSVALDPDLKEYYKNLSEEEKGSVIRLAAVEINALRDAQEKSNQESSSNNTADQQYLSQLPEEEQARINQVVRSTVRARLLGTEPHPDPELKEYYASLSEEEKERVYRLAAVEINSLRDLAEKSQQEKEQQQEEDKEFLSNLPEAEQSRVVRIVDQQVEARLLNRKKELENPELKQYYNKLSEEEKERVYRLAAVEIESLREIAGRVKARQEEQYAADNAYFSRLPAEEQRKVSRIVAANVTAQLLNKEEARLDPDLKAYYETLSDEEKERVYRLAAVEIESFRKLSAQAKQRKSEQAARDRAYLQQLPEEKQTRINQVVDQQVMAKLLGKEEAMDPELKEFYESLPEEERERVYRLAAVQVESLRDLAATSGNGTAAEEAITRASFSKLGAKEQYRVNQAGRAIAKARLLGKENADMDPEVREFYEKLSEEEKDQVYQLAGILIESARDLAEKEQAARDEQVAADEKYFSKLSEEARFYVDRAVRAQARAKMKNSDSPLMDEDTERFYSKLSEEEKERIDRLANAEAENVKTLLARNEEQARKQAEADQEYMANLPEEEKEYISQVVEATLQARLLSLEEPPLSEDADAYYSSLSEEEKNRINRVTDARQDRLVKIAGQLEGEKKEQAIEDLARLAMLPDLEQRKIGKLIDAQIRARLLGMEKVQLEPELQEFYDGLSKDDKKRIFRLSEIEIEALRLVGEKSQVATVAAKAEETLDVTSLSFSGRQHVAEMVEARINAMLLGTTPELDQPTQLFYEQLNEEQKKAVDQRVNEQVKALGKLAARQVAEDEQSIREQMQRLDEESKNRVSRATNLLVQAHFKEAGRDQKQAQEEAGNPMQQLAPAEKRLVEQAVAARIRAVNKVTESPELMRSVALQVAGEQVADDLYYYDRLSEKEQDNVDNMISMLIMEEAGIRGGRDARDARKQYENLPDEEQQRVQRLAQVRKAQMKSTVRNLLNEEQDGEEEVYAYNTFNSKDYEQVTITGKIIDPATDKPVANVTVPLVNEEGEVVKTTKTNKQGEFRYVNIDADQSYRVALENESRTLTKKNNYHVVDFSMKGNTKRQVSVNFENVYFDLNKSSLRPEAKQILDELVAYAAKNPDMQVTINAYADIFGDEGYNRALSKKRGDNVYDYLIKGGLDETDIVVNALGEITTNNYSANDYAKRQYDRRVEFYIANGKEEHLPQTTMHLVKPGVTLYRIATQLNVSQEKLRQMNGLESDTLRAYQPLRVPDQHQDKFTNLFLMMEPISEAKEDEIQTR